MHTDDQDRLKAKLAERQQQLKAAEATLQQSAQPVGLDQTSVGRLSRVDTIQAQELSLEAVRRNVRQQELVAAALERIAAGTYGDCQRCGAAIAVERLLFDPAATHCVGCAGTIR